MRKRLSSKLLAVILTVAICATTVFGCLMTVSAADSCYSFSSVEVSDDLTEATIGVTFTAPASLPNGFFAGAFSIDQVDADAADKLTIKSVSGSGVSAEIEGNNVVFNADAAKSIATLQLTFGFSKGTATKGKDYKIQLSGVELSYNDSEYYVESATGAIGKISTECEHVIGVVGEPLKIDTANNYSVYENSVCTICGEEFGIQLVPTAEKLNADGAAGTVTGKVVYWDNTKTAPTSTAAGTKDDPIIINTPAELAYIATATNSAGTVNPNKYYKIADDVKAFVLQPETYGADIMALSGSDAVSAYFSDTSKTFYQWQGVSDMTNIFSGHFDGNGITIYGLYNTQTGKRQGLFGEVDGNATISNVTVKGAYITTTQGWNDQGAIVGSNRNKYGVGPGTSGQDTLVIKNCSVIDCYMRSSDTANDNRSANGVIAGRSNTGLIMIDSCFVSGNDTLFTNNTLSQEYALYGNALNSWNVDSSSAYFRGAYDNYYPNAVATAATGNCVCNMVVNTVAIGTLPYHLGYYGNRLDNKECFINVYTDGPAGTVANSYVSGGNTVSVPTTYAENQIASVATANLKGSAAAIAMPNLDWGKTWLVGKEGEYPYLATPDYVSDTIYWDGTTATGVAEGSGTPEDPYIINTAAELAYIAIAGYDATNDKIFKIADGIENIVLQSYAYGADIMALDSAADVKTYFEGLASPKNWAYKSYKDYMFAGTFDGNGATVYGLYSTDATGGARIASLFPLVEGNATIKNIALENSYLKTTSTSANYNFGGLIGSTPGLSQNSNADDSGIVWVDSCTVANNYMYAEPNNINRAGLVVGNIQDDTVIMSNCLVYGNDATAKLNSAAQYDLHIMGTIKTTVTPTDDFAAAHPTWIHSGYVKAMVIDSIILDTPVYNTGVAGFSDNYRFQHYQCYEDVYTDMTLADGQYTSAELYATTITTISRSQATGSQAKNTMPNLAWGEKWYCGAEGEPPVLAPFATFGASDKSTFAHQLYGSSVTYNNDGTLDFNLHFVPQYEGIEATLYVGTADTSKFYKLTATESSYRDELGGTALMFTLPNISARDIDKVWLPTLVVEGGEKTEWGKTQPVALVDNAIGVLEGDYASTDKRVSAALVNYNVTADDALSVATKPSSESNVVYVQYGSAPNMEPDGSFMDGTHGTGTETDPYVISTPGQLRYLAQKSTYETTHGKFFEIDENIDILCLQAKSYIGDINKFMTKSAEEVMTFLSNATNRTQWQSGNSNPNDCFSGTLDGNGVTIVGMYTSNGGLFNVANEGATFKNITVKNSYISAGWYAGAILGSAYASETYIATIPNNTNCYGVVSFDNITVNDNYILNKGNAQQCTGALVGAVTTTYRDLLDKTTVAEGVPGTDGTKESYAHIAVYASNILTYDNSIWAETVKDSGNIVSNQTLFGKLSTGHNGMDAGYPNGSYDNIVTIDCVPFAFEASNQAFRAPYFRNVYSGLPQPDYTPSTWYAWNQFDITFVDAANLTGAAAKTAMPDLDWVNTWAVTDEYPVLADIDYVAPATGGKTIYWDGTRTAPTSTAAGTEADPIIINTAAELNYVIRHAGPSVTTGKYYKIADGIEKIVLQPEGALDVETLLACKDGAAVKAYFDTLDTSKLVTWQGGGVFNGNIDGNGVQIVGLYDTTTNLAGLVGAFDGGKQGVKGTPANDSVGNTIKGFTVGYSYLKSTTRLGMFGSQAYNDNYGAYVIGTWNVDSCAVINCYMEQTTQKFNSGHSGIVTGDALTDTIKLNNILVYGNKAFSSVDGKNIWMRAGTKSGQKVWVDGVETEEINYPTISNSIVLGTTPYRTDWIDNNTHGPNLYSNVYTDAPVGTVTLNSGGQVTYTDAQLKGVSNLEGANAQSVVDALNAANDSTVWYVGALGDVPGFKKAGNVPSLYQSAINSVVFNTADTVGAGTEYYDTGSMKFGVYQTALSLKANPYMSFAFAFGGDYKTNRDKIKIKFTYTENGALTTSEEISVPAYTGEDIKNVNGWTNTTANGRFHTFKADMIPVEALAYGIKVEVNYNNTGWKDFGTYSVEGLGMQFETLSKTQPGDYYSTRVEAAKALLFYAQAIAARYGAQ